MFCCIYLTICDGQVLLKYFIDKYYWDILTGSYLCFYFYPIFGKERPHMILRNMSKSVLTVDCFCHPLVMLHRWLEKSRSVMLGHLKNLAASSLAISENGSVWEWPQRLRNVLSQKNSPKNLQNADAARSQTCTFTMGPGSGWPMKPIWDLYVFPDGGRLFFRKFIPTFRPMNPIWVSYYETNMFSQMGVVFF